MLIKNSLKSIFLNFAAVICNDLPCENDDNIIIEERFASTKIECCGNRVSLNLKDFNMFEVRTSTNSRQVIVDSCRSIRGREYNPKSKVWLLYIH